MMKDRPKTQSFRYTKTRDRQSAPPLPSLLQLPFLINYSLSILQKSSFILLTEKEEEKEGEFDDLFVLWPSVLVE